MAIGILEVMLGNAKGLGCSDFFGGMDPYVLVQYKSQEHKSSVARVEGKTSVWNEKIAVKVEYPGADEHYKLILKIMDKDTFSADDFIGQVTIYIRDLLAQGVDNGTAELPSQKYSVVTADQSYLGEVQVALTFTAKVPEEIDMEEVGGWRQSDY
ncbi:elicitor-responsive protein 1 [Tripterygium wilfordii]|uniref:Elicitor-responsive protein 1 n=1 Tax=Tripterygium wilfordii TaxID=458696 RepID=A0A7J7C6M5_TRIWF|nr:16 kDa phloem protein 1 [Tripterygium wilfordii]KAF5729595.1 elicitor-responsive protein 1 [Tripterygium wilfordii]